MILYKFHNQPDQLTGFATATESVPSVAWEACEGDLKKLRLYDHLWVHDPKLAYNYARYVLQGPFPQGEPAIAQVSSYAYAYAHEVLRNRRFPAGEPAIAQDPGWAYQYARYVLDGPFPLGEPVIAQDPYYACSYARDVLDRPFPQGEPVIARDPYWAFEYARYVLGRPWPAGEPAIARQQTPARLYVNVFPKREKIIDQLIQTQQSDK